MFTMDIQTLINVLSEIYDNKENYDIMKFYAAVNQHRIIIRSYININLYCEFYLANITLLKGKINPCPNFYTCTFN
jgi:hypothetical protein